MKARSVTLFYSMGVALVFAVRPASATELEDAAQSGPVVSAPDLRFGIAPGIFFNRTDGGALVSLYGLAQWNFLEGGLTGQVGGAGLNYTVDGGGLLGGLGASTRWGLHGDVLGEVGVEHYRGVDRDWLFHTDPGASATLPYVGVRAGLSYRFAPRAHSHLQLGVWGIFQDDVQRDDVRYSYGSSSGASEAEHTVGAQRFALLLDLGGSFDL